MKFQNALIIRALLFMVSSAHVLAQLGPDIIINTTHGRMRGIDEGYSYAFLGVPFAKPPVGDLRLRDPQPMDPWDDIYEANEKSPGCMQVCVQPPDGCPSSVRFSI